MAKKILVVDDSFSMRELVAYTLGSAGYEVTAARDGAEALDITERRGFDMVVTDWNMPGVDGLELARRLRMSADNARVPILLISTEAGASDRESGRQAGASGWIRKPFSSQELLKAVRRLVG